MVLGAPAGTIVLLPGQEDAPLFGHRVQILYRQVDPVPGRASVRCRILDGPVLGADETGVAVAEVEWDDPKQIAAWVSTHPEPQGVDHRRTNPYSPR